MLQRIIGLLTALFVSGCATNGIPGPPGPIEPPQFEVGEQWSYNERNGYNGLLIGNWTGAVVETQGTNTTLALKGKGQTHEAIVDHLDGGLLQEVFPGGQTFSYSQPLAVLPLPIAPGASWHSRTAATDLATGKKTIFNLHGKVRGWERVQVPAGEFVALKVVKDLYLGDQEWWRSQTRRTIVDWYAPEAKAIVRRTTSDEYRDLLRSRDSWFFDDQLIRGDRYVWELASYRLAGEDKGPKPAPAGLKPGTQKPEGGRRPEN